MQLLPSMRSPTKQLERKRSKRDMDIQRFIGTLLLSVLLVASSRGVATSGQPKEARLAARMVSAYCTRNVDTALSPANVALLFAALAEGTRGTLRSELRDFASEAVGAPQGTDQGVSQAIGIWLASSLDLDSSFAASVKARLREELFVSHTGELSLGLGAWLAQHHVSVPEPAVSLDPGLLSIATASSYRDQFVVPFDKRSTRAKIFWGRTGPRVEQFMSGERVFLVFEDAAIRAVRLDLRGGAHIDLIESRKRASPCDLLGTYLSKPEPHFVADRPRVVEIPRVSLRGKWVDLRAVLASRTLASLFDQKSRPIVALVRGKHVALNHLIHATQFALFEEGVDASAASIGSVALAPSPVIRFDHPFSMVVTDGRGVIMFTATFS